MKATKREMKIIAKAMNCLLKNSNITMGCAINVLHMQRFRNPKYTIDYTQKKRFKVYKRDKKMRYTKEIFYKN